MSTNGSHRGSPDVDESCSVLDNGERCVNSATSATFSKKFLKSVNQRRQKLFLDPAVSGSN